jgi:hypothetical protein
MTQDSPSSLLDSGIDVVGEMEWGTHISLFYETRADLVDVVAPFLATGLLAGELCGWIPSDGEAEVAVRDGLRDRRLRRANGTRPHGIRVGGELVST